MAVQMKRNGMCVGRRGEGLIVAVNLSNVKLVGYKDMLCERHIASSTVEMRLPFYKENLIILNG